MQKPRRNAKYISLVYLRYISVLKMGKNELSSNLKQSISMMNRKTAKFLTNLTVGCGIPVRHFVRVANAYSRSSVIEPTKGDCITFMLS